MSDEPKKVEAANGDWTMPEPVFRSTQGYRPKSSVLSAQDDIPTEPGFNDDETEEDIPVPDVAEESPDEEKARQSVRASTKTRIRHPKKKSGCAKTFGLIAGAIVLSLAALVTAVVYFLFFYRPSGTTF